MFLLFMLIFILTPYVAVSKSFSEDVKNGYYVAVGVVSVILLIMCIFN